MSVYVHLNGVPAAFADEDDARAEGAIASYDDEAYAVELVVDGLVVATCTAGEWTDESTPSPPRPKFSWVVDTEVGLTHFTTEAEASAYAKEHSGTAQYIDNFDPL